MQHGEKFGWRVPEWASSVGLSRAYVYELLNEGKICSVKIGTARIITTHPLDYLSSLADADKAPVDIAPTSREAVPPNENDAGPEGCAAIEVPWQAGQARPWPRRRRVRDTR
jgi:hypothetical protein